MAGPSNWRLSYGLMASGERPDSASVPQPVWHGGKRKP